MPDLLLELFSEEIPARMQARAADDLARLVGEALAALDPAAVETFYGPRRIALAARLAAEIPARSSLERGPRIAAPEQAVAGFLRKHTATPAMLVQDDGYWVLHKSAPAQSAANLVASALPGLLRRFPWPKSMRWGGSGSAFTWVRPLRRILCLLDGAMVAFDLRDGADDGHGLASGAVTEGHRFFDATPFTVASLADWREGLAARRVVVDAAERRTIIMAGLARLAAAQGAVIVDDPALLDEVAGLVEWPAPKLGRIDAAYMDLPTEVMQVSMRVNQRYFALRTEAGGPAPYFGFAANIEAADGGAALIAGNERVLRARFADARHFWDLDRQARLADRVAALDAVTFHAKLGSQGARVHRLMQLAEHIAPMVGADPALAARAAWLAKADLTTGMVGEFPELQGVMGRYYALHDGEDPAVADAIRDHYAPRGPGDAVPSAPVTVALALADKIEFLFGLMGAGESPTGSRDPFGLRRAAIGYIRIVYERRIALSLGNILHSLAKNIEQDKIQATESVVSDFIRDRVPQFISDFGINSIYYKAAIEKRGVQTGNHDFVADIDKTIALREFIEARNGVTLLSGYRRARNILRIENVRDGVNIGVPGAHDERGPIDQDLLRESDRQLQGALQHCKSALQKWLPASRFDAAFGALAQMASTVDAFFDNVRVNAPEPEVRSNRLRLLYELCATMEQVADFSVLIEG